MNYTKEQIADALDLAVLSPMATYKGVVDACNLAARWGIRSVCVSPTYTRLAASLHRTSTVVGFPFGSSTPDVKYHEAVTAIRNGARELDVVVNYSRFLDGDSVPMTSELAVIVSSAHQAGVLVKAILEVCYYTIQQIIDACKICVDCGVDFVKTSTGFGLSGALPLYAHAMIDTVEGRCGVKASGGIKTYAEVCQYLDMGCTRIGASNYFNLLP